MKSCSAVKPAFTLAACLSRDLQNTLDYHHRQTAAAIALLKVPARFLSDPN